MSSPVPENTSYSPQAKAPTAESHSHLRTDTTGSYWQDVKLAVKRISPVDDMKRIDEIPCARGALLNGIASGVGIGFIRALRASPFVASNWAMGTFVLVSVGSWTICQKNRERELRDIAQVIESNPRRFIKQASDDGRVQIEKDSKQ